MVSFLEAVGDAARAAFCNVLGDLGAFEANINNALGIQDPAPGPAGAAYSWVCDRPRPVREIPFEGGQCPALYYVVINRKSTTRVGGPGGAETNFDQDFDGNYQGPIQGVIDKATYPAQSSQIYVRHNNTESFRNTGSVGAGVQIIRSTVSIKSVTRLGGQPDNCGNPDPVPPSPPAPGYNEYPTDLDYDDPDGKNFSFPIVIAVGYANVGITGELNIPMTFNFNLNPEFNFEINFNINTGKPELVQPRPGKPNPGKPTDPLDPLPLPDPDSPPFPDPDYPDDDEEEEEPKKKKLLRGVIVTSTAPPASISKVFQETNPDLMLPDLGQVQFQIQVGTILSWTGHTKVQSRRHFIPCPWEFGAVAVSGTPRPGITWQLTPVYIEQTYAPKYPPDQVAP